MSTTQGADPTDDCLETRYWFYYLASSLIVFFVGLIVIITYRIIEYLTGCRLTAAVTGRSRTPDDEKSILVNGAAKIKWNCEKLVSGQTFVGRILVSPMTSCYYY